MQDHPAPFPLPVKRVKVRLAAGGILALAAPGPKRIMSLSWEHITPVSVKKAGRGVFIRTVTLAFRVSARPGIGRARGYFPGYGSSPASKNTGERFLKIYCGIMPQTSGLSFAKMMVAEFRSTP